jgi:hypothetical protein
MKTITLDVPDELASRLAPLQAQLPGLLSFALDLLGVESAKGAPSPQSFPILREIIDFLVQGPSYTQIIEFKVSPEAQKRLEVLLDRNREDELSPQELAELDAYQQVDHFMILLKARARRALASAN